MLYYDRINFSREVDVNKTSSSKEFDICHYWYFLDDRFKFYQNSYNGYHEVLMMFVNLNNIAILSIQGVDYTGQQNETFFSHHKRK